MASDMNCGETEENESSKERIELPFCNFSEGFTADENPMNSIIYHVSKLTSGRIPGISHLVSRPVFQALSQNLNDFPGSLSGLQIKECAFKQEQS